VTHVDTAGLAGPAGGGLDPLGAGPTARAEDSGGSVGREALARLRRSPVAIIGAALVLLFLLVAIFAPLLASYAPADPVLAGEIRPGIYPGPSAQHWLGVDRQGRDELSRLIYGSRQSLLVGVVATAIGFAGGMLLGLLAGAFGGWVDGLLMRIVDVLLSIPGLLLAITIAAVLGQSLTSVMLAIAVVQIPIFARLLRGSMLAQRESDYVLAARSLGVRRRRIVLGHMLPNSLSPVIVQATLSLATAIIDAAALSYLGMSGTPGSVPEWGRMLAEAQQDLAAAPRLAFIPCIAIVIAALGFTLLGESLREALDPRFRR
jgi:peptide/nickel transport system permease protein